VYEERETEREREKERERENAEHSTPQLRNWRGEKICMRWIS